MFIVLFSALVVASVMTMVVLVAGERDIDEVKANLGGPSGLRDSRQIALSASARTRLLEPLLNSLGRRVRGMGSTALAKRVQRKIELAGLSERGWTVERVIVLRIAAFFAGAGASILLLSQASSRQNLGMAALALILGYLAPEAWLDRQAGDRQSTIEKHLPDVIDQMTVSVEAGLGFDAAMARSAEGKTGPLADELARVLQDIHVGVPRHDALERLVERTDVNDLRAFVVAVRQSTKHGLPIAKVLQVQSQELREKRRARVEELAGQLPVKIVFPLVFCILPSLFVIILGPAAINIAENF